MRGDKISTQALEYVYQFEFVNAFVREGFNIYVPAWDTGVDFVLMKEFDPKTAIPDIIIKVQLKSRWTIEKKYIGRKIWIAFPNHPIDFSQLEQSKSLKRIWYLMPHDLMVGQALHDHGTSKSFSEGHYSKGAVPKSFVRDNHTYETTNVLAHIAKQNSVAALDAERYSEWPSLPRLQ